MPGQLDPVEERVGGLLVSIILSLQFNCHSVTEATDAIQSRSVETIDRQLRLYCRVKILNGQYENRSRYAFV